MLCSMAVPDREAVKTLAIAIGVREAARKLGLNEDTVCSWAKREKWFAQPASVPQPPAQTIDLQALQAKPSDALAEALRDDSRETRVALSKAARKAAVTFRDMSGPKVIQQSQQLRHITDTAAKVHSWDQQNSTPGPLTLQVLTQQANIQVALPDQGVSE